MTRSIIVVPILIQRSQTVNSGSTLIHLLERYDLSISVALINMQQIPQK